MAKQASDTLDLVRSRRLVFTAAITKMFSKMTKGQLTALTTILKINTARTSGESLSRIDKGLYGTEAQLANVELIAVLFMFSRLTFFVPCVCSAIEEAVRLHSLTTRLFVVQLRQFMTISWTRQTIRLAYCLTFCKLVAKNNYHPLTLSFICFLKPHFHLQKSI